MRDETALEARLQDWADGKSTLQEVRQYSDEELFSISRIGYFYFCQGKLDEARKIFHGLFALNPMNSYFARALGVIEMAAGNDKGAVAAYDVALRLNPEDAAALVARAEIRLFQKSRMQAIEDLRRAQHVAGADAALKSKIFGLLRSLVRK
jgi:cytochrome c-type biogenesis protein CcmH/NrfG